MEKRRTFSKWFIFCFGALSPILFYSMTFGGSCGSRTDLFTVEPLDPGAYFEIASLGSTNPPGHTFPTVHTYLMRNDMSNPTPVYAPGDITITAVSRLTYHSTGETDYSITFSPCTEVTGYYNHVTDLPTDLLDQIGDFTNCWTYSEYQLCNKQVSIEVSAGTILGAGGLDFGLRDTRVTPIPYVNPGRLINQDQLYVVCPYDYYAPGTVRDNVFAKLRVFRTDEPVCGTVDVDIADTAQGRWYLVGSTGSGEMEGVALVPDNSAPSTVGVLSVGNASVGTEAYYFDFSASGQINRLFGDVTADGNNYCYDNLRNRPASLESGHSDPIQGYLFLKMTSNATLVLERVDQDTSCPNDPNTLFFSDAAVEFERSAVRYVNKNDDTCGSASPCYSTIQTAIDAAGTGSTLKMAQGSYDEALILSASKELTFQGGWDSTFTTQSSTTIIHSMTLSNDSGTIEIDNLVLQ